MKKILLTLLPLLLCVNLNALDDDSEIKELKNQVKELLKRIEALEAKRSKEQTAKLQSTTVSSKQKSLAKAPPKKQKGLLELKSSDTVIGIGGKIELQSTYGWPEGSLTAGNIPLSKTGENGQLSMNARNSRLWVKTRTPSKYGPVRSLVEIDFFGSSGTENTTNSHNPRLRHAYVQAAGFTAGQTNSVFNGFVAMDTINDYINYTLVRQPIISYSINDKDLGYDISFEQPESTLLDKDGSIITPQDDVLPDVVARVRYYPSWGEAAIAFMGRYIAQDHATLSDGTTLNNSDSALGWAANMSAKINVFDLDDIRFGAQYGMGIGRYLAYNAYSAGSVDANGNIELQPSYGAHLGYRHWWNSEVKSTLALSYCATQNNLKGVSNLNGVNKEAFSFQANLLWVPLPNALVGIEYSKGIRKVETDQKGYIDLMTLIMRYNF